MMNEPTLNIRNQQLLTALLAGIPFLLVYLVATYFWGPYAGLALFAGLAAVVFIFQQPIYGLLFCLLIIFSGFVWGLGIKQGFLPVAIFSAVAVMTRNIYTLDFSFAHDRQVTYIMAFFAVMVLSILGALFPMEAFKSLVVYGKLFIFYFLIINAIKTRWHIWASAWVFILSNIGSVLYGFYNLFFAPHSAGEMMVKARMRGLTDDPNILAMEVVFIIPPILLIIFHEGWKWRSVLYLSGVFILLAGLIASFSRGGTVSLGIVLAMVLYQKRSWPLFLTMLGAAVVLVIFVIPVSFWEHLLTLFDLGKFLADPSLRWRGRLSIGAIEQFIQHPLLGIGIGNWMQIASKYMSLRPLAVHNTYLHVAAEMGVFGIVFFLLIFMRTFTNFNTARYAFAQQGDIKLSLLSHGFFIGLVGVFVGAMFLSVQEAFVIWTIFGFSVAMRHVSQSPVAKGTA